MFCFSVKPSDLSPRTFATGMIVAVLCSLGAVAVMILCAVFRVDLALLYRDLAAKDETLGGKIWLVCACNTQDLCARCTLALFFVTPACRENWL